MGIKLQPEQAAHRSYHYLPLSTTLVVDEVDSSGFRQSSLQIGSLLAIAKESTSVGRAVRAFLWITGEVKEGHFQLCVNGTRYLELCPSYLATVDGVTRWAAREAWAACLGILRWVEHSAQVASAFGARLRDLTRGQRWGRHMFLTEQQHQALMIAANTARESGLLSEYDGTHGTCGAPVAEICGVDWGRCPGVRTTAVRCPFPHNHKGGDRNPSLVLWRPNEGGIGGAMCMVCTNDQGTQKTWAVRYGQNTATMYASRTTTKETKAQAAPAHTSHRHNKHPYVSEGGPVGGCVAHHYPLGNGTFVGATLSARRSGYGIRLSRSHGNRLRGDPVSCLQWSESRSRGSAASERAAYLRYVFSDDLDVVSEEWIPTPLCSVSSMEPTGWVDTKFGAIPSAWSSKVQRWVLFDIDDIAILPGCSEGVGAAIARVARRDIECSGRLAVVRTGPHGLQVWVELREARHSPISWHRAQGVVDWYSKLGRRLLLGCHRAGAGGGHVDMSSCSAGRFGRRPGWRLLSDGGIFRSQLLHVANERLPNRPPRLTHCTVPQGCL